MTEQEQDLLTDLLVKWEEAFDEGRDIPAAELCTECPHLTAELQTKIDSLKATSWIKRDPARPLTDRREAEAKDLTGTVLADRYRLDQFLGRGGYGQVYRGHDLKLHRDVAIKIGHARTSSDFLLDEARRVARLKHPCIVGVHDCLEYEGRMCLVFELVEGKSLADVIRDRKLPVTEAVMLVATIAEALHHAHKQGCIHRDIKPENILIDAEGKPRIADFGVACTFDEIAKNRVASSGTLAYMAPEQVAQETQLLDGRCDVHALGVLLFELLTGRSPFPARTPAALREQILFRQPMMLRAADPSLPVALEVICSKAMAKHPADRFESAEAMANELRSWLKDSRRKRRWMIWAMIALVVIAVLGVVVAWTMRAAPFVRDGAIHFDGRTRIVTPVERKLPVTLEAIVRPDAYTGTDCQFVIGSDVPMKYGIGLGICGSVLSAEYHGGMINSSVTVPPGEWSHIAGVFTESETLLFINGKLIHAGPGGKSDDAVAKFVLGNVGETNPIAFFHGDVRSVRISEGERYSTDFRPTERFSSDDTTLAIYAAESVDGKAVRDQSGNGNNGQIETTSGK